MVSIHDVILILLQNIDFWVLVRTVSAMYALSQNIKKKYIFFYNGSFASEKYHCILHGHVVVMSQCFKLIYHEIRALYSEIDCQLTTHQLSRHRLPI